MVCHSCPMALGIVVENSLLKSFFSHFPKKNFAQLSKHL